jgi:environmental stress-induced protein Ves
MRLRARRRVDSAARRRSSRSLRRRRCAERTLLDGPSRDFNVMTRRGAGAPRSCARRAHAAGRRRLLLCCAASWQLDGDRPAARAAALLWRDGCPRCAAPARRRTRAAACACCQDRR